MKERIPSLVAATVLALTGIAGLVDGLAPARAHDSGVEERPDATCSPAPADPGG